MIKSLIKIYIKYCQKLDFEAFPEYSNEKLNNKHKHIKLGIWDPKKKHKNNSRCQSILSIGGWTLCFTIWFSYWFSITTINNPIVPNQTKNGSAQPMLFFFIWGSLVIGRRGYIYTHYYSIRYDLYRKKPPKVYSSWFISYKVFLLGYRLDS